MQNGLNARLHLLLNQTGKAPHKKELVSSFTSGRSDSSRDMTDQEARDLISYLEGSKTTPDPADRMRKKVISMAREIGWEIRNNNGKVADMQRIRNWVTKYGYLKKPLNDYTANELPRLVTQFEKVYQDFLHKV